MPDKFKLPLNADTAEFQFNNGFHEITVLGQTFGFDKVIFQLVTIDGGDTAPAAFFMLPTEVLDVTSDYFEAYQARKQETPEICAAFQPTIDAMFPGWVIVYRECEDEDWGFAFYLKEAA